MKYVRNRVNLPQLVKQRLERQKVFRVWGDLFSEPGAAASKQNKTQLSNMLHEAMESEQSCAHPTEEPKKFRSLITVTHSVIVWKWSIPSLAKLELWDSTILGGVLSRAVKPLHSSISINPIGDSEKKPQQLSKIGAGFSFYHWIRLTG